MSRILISCFLLTLSFIAVGCSNEGAGLLAVKGTVHLQNKPLDTGNIFFELDDPANPHQSGATIENGKYSIPKARGLKPGKYLVRISSADEKAKEEKAAPGDSRILAKNRIPPEWNSESTKKIDVNDGATEFNFDIK